MAAARLTVAPPISSCTQALLQKSAAGRQAYFQAEMLTQAERIVRWVLQQVRLACCQDECRPGLF